MQIKKATDYFHGGLITGFEAVRDPLTPGNWVVQVHLKGSKGATETIETFRGGFKSYATTDALIADVERMTGNVSSFKLVTN